MASAFRTLDAGQLETSVVDSLRRSLTACCDDNAALQRTLELARAAAIAVIVVDSKPLRIRLLDALDGGDGPELGRQHRELDAVLSLCVREWEAGQGVVVGPDAVAYFLTGRHAQRPPPVPADAASLSCAICISVVGWAFTLVGLASLLTCLSMSFARSARTAMYTVQYQPARTLQLPVISVCPGVAPSTPLFSRGGGPAFSSLPLVTVASVELPRTGGAGGLHTTLSYPATITNLTTVVDCSQGLFQKPPLGERPQRPSGPGRPCAPCLRFAIADRPTALREGQVLRVRVAMHRFLDWCMFPQPRQTNERILSSFALVLASKIERLRDGGFLRDVTGASGLSGLRSSEPAATAAALRNNTVDPNLQADLFCNAFFMSGLWYPVAGGESSMSGVGFDWVDTFWRRRHPESDAYWDVVQRRGADRPSSEEDEQISGPDWRVFAEDASTAAPDGAVPPNTLVGDVSHGVNARFMFRRRNDTDNRVDVTAPISVSTHTRVSSSAQSLYEYTTIQFGFDRHLVRQRAGVRARSFSSPPSPQPTDPLLSHSRPSPPGDRRKT
jgi:hypothetical protein